MLFNTLSFASAVFAAVVSCSLAQYPYQVAPPAPRHTAPTQHYQQPQQPARAQHYQPQSEPAQRYESQPAQEEYYQPAAPSPRRPSVVHNPAPVHYVNIGEQLQGDYKFGYDTGKGDDGQSFREETRLPDGTVQGAYGYVDAGGVQRIVRYTAGKDGFRAEGDGLPKAAPAPAAQAPARQSPRPAYQEPAHQSPRPAYQAPAPQPRPTYSAPAQPAYSAPSHSPRPAPRYRAPRPEPAQPSYDYQDLNDPNNDLSDTAHQVPIDTSLFNYNIGASPPSRS